MTLKQLLIEEEPAQEISYVPLASSEEVEPDPELPGDFTMQDDLDLLQDSATALESIGNRIACEGIDLSTARELEQLSPGFMRKAGGHNTFTHRPSLEGLAPAVSTVKERMMDIIRRIRTYVAESYKRFVAWLTAKFSKKENLEFTQEVNEFLSQRRSQDAVKYLDSLPEDTEEAAREIARWMDGDTDAFVQVLTEQLRSVTGRVEAIEKAMIQDPVHYRLARGVVTVADLFKEDANSAIVELLKKAVATADRAMKTRNAEQFEQALADITAVSAEIEEFEKNMVVNTKPSPEYGDDKAVPLSKLIDNIAQVAKDMEKVSVQQQAKTMTDMLNNVIRLSEGTAIEEILEMIPEDVPAEKHNSYAQQLSSLYRRIAKLGNNILSLWRIRAGSISSINHVGTSLMGLVSFFEQSVVSASASLSSEQKAQLTKALAAKGIKIAY